ncbi:MAG: rhomboid family intramembrane serine protease [Ignavibacteriales bacterium]|nr:rhomboid family intramembrane serine protease [Ignavibacteriales bacterium]
MFPQVIKLLLIANLIVFLIQLTFESRNIDNIPGWYILFKHFALNPIAGLDPAGQPYNFQIWQLFTYQFMHDTSGFSHIFFNMFALWMFGRYVAMSWGSKKFFWFYILCGVVAGIFQIFISPEITDKVAWTIGASGSVFGVLIAFAMMFPNEYIVLLIPPIPMKAKYFVGFYIVFEFLSVGDAGGVAHMAHIGGALAGFIFMLFTHPNYKYKLSTFFKNIGLGSKSSSESEHTEYKEAKVDKDIEEAKYYDLKDDKSEIEVTQVEIDRILDKIGESGYQNLTEREKKILFEASKKK